MSKTAPVTQLPFKKMNFHLCPLGITALLASIFLMVHAPVDVSAQTSTVGTTPATPLLGSTNSPSGGNHQNALAE